MTAQDLHVDESRRRVEDGLLDPGVARVVVEDLVRDDPRQEREVLELVAPVEEDESAARWRR